jgi:signal transduction histidine kinase
MTRPSLLGSSTFRLALGYLVLFAGSVLVLLAFIYFSTVAFMSNQVDTTIDTEIVGLAEQYREGGLNALVRTIEDRVERNPTGSSLYLFTTRSGRPLAGNLSGWPAQPADADDWLDFEISADESGGSLLRARARVFTLAGGFRLLVGRDVRELQASQALIEQALWWGLAITIGLGLIGGYALSRSVLRRIEIINETSRDIISGDLSRRVPVGGSSEFDELAVNLNAMLDQIERLMAAIKQVSDNIAHDLRTPLTRLRTGLDSLRDASRFAPDNEQNLEQLERSIQDADQLLSTFNALLRISRLESGGHELEAGNVALPALLQDALELYEAVAEDKHVHLALDAHPATAKADRDLLFQALCNLLDNAVKFTPRDGQVTLSCSTEGNQACIKVTDTGPGVAEAELDRITERFYRTEASRSTAGSGLGLSLVTAIAHAHGGNITFTNQATGLAATLCLPSGSASRS